MATTPSKFTVLSTPPAADAAGACCTPSAEATAAGACCEESVAAAPAACCGSEPAGAVGTNATAVKDAVRARYSAAARRVTAGGASCCGTASRADDPITSNLYDQEMSEV